MGLAGVLVVTVCPASSFLQLFFLFLRSTSDKARGALERVPNRVLGVVDVWEQASLVPVRFH